MPPVHKGIDAFRTYPRPYPSGFIPITLLYRISRPLSFLFFSQRTRKKGLQKGFIGNTPGPSFPPLISLRSLSIRRVKTSRKDLPPKPKLHEFKDTSPRSASPKLGEPANTPGPSFSHLDSLPSFSIRRYEIRPKYLPPRPKLHEFKDTSQRSVSPKLGEPANTPDPFFGPSFPSLDSRASLSIRRYEIGPKDLPPRPKLHEFKDTSQGYISPQLGNPALYKELKCAALKGDFVRTHVLVEELVKRRGEAPNIRLYHALILANTSPQYGSPTEVMKLLDEIGNEGLALGPAIYHAVLKVLAIHPHYVMRKDVLEQLRQRWFTVTEEGWHDMIVGMIRDRQLEMVLDTVELLQGEEEGTKIKPWLYDMIVYTLCDVEEFDEALKIMRYRVSSGELLISGTLWFYLLDTASRALHHDATLYVWRERVETSYLNPPLGVCINVLSTAARCGDTHLATDVFRILRRRSETLQLFHYESLLETYLAASDLKTAFTLLSVMISAGVPPSEASIRPIYLYLRRDASFPASALSIIRNLRESNRLIYAPAVDVIMEAFIHHQDFDSAIETYMSLPELCPSGPTTSTFNVLIRGCARAIRKDIAMFLASEMVALKVSPNALTYDRLVLVCLNADAKESKKAEEDAEEHKTGEDFADAWRYFMEMRRMSWWPRDGTLVALAKRCCEQGDERVWELVGEGGQRRAQRGMGIQEMQRFVSEHWRGEEQTMG